MRALFVVRRPGSGSVRIRVEQMRPVLADAGIDTDVVVWGSSGGFDRLVRPVRLLRAARRADVVVLHKPALPGRLLDLLERVNPHLVVDVDDAVWASVDHGQAPGAVATRFDAALARAELAIAGSEHLARALRRRRPGLRVEVLRPSVCLTDYEPAAAPPAVPTLGWLGGSGNQADLVPEVRSVLAQWCERHGGELVVVSDAPPTFTDVPTRFVQWTPEGEAAAAAGFTIGLMPLRDDERSAGRCGFKAIQCLAAGVPVVASPVGAACEVIGDGCGGLLAEGRDGWDVALEQLIADPALRRRLGDAGRAWVDREASVATTGPRLAALLRGLVR